MTKSVALSLRFGKNELHYWCSVCKFLKQLSANNEQPVVEWKGCAFCWKDWHTLADTLIWYLDLEETQLSCALSTIYTVLDNIYEVQRTLWEFTLASGTL